MHRYMRQATRSRLARRSTRLPAAAGSCFATRVTRDDHVMELRILGPLEIRVGPEAVPLGGGKQRIVLAALLLRAGEVVSVEQLVDELWGESPPASAAHTRRGLCVSRLRQLLNGHGPALRPPWSRVRARPRWSHARRGGVRHARRRPCRIARCRRRSRARGRSGHGGTRDLARAGARQTSRSVDSAEVETERFEELRLRTSSSASTQSSRSADTRRDRRRAAVARCEEPRTASACRTAHAGAVSLGAARRSSR